MLSRRTFLATTALSGAWFTARGASPQVAPLKIAPAAGVLERAVGCDVGDQIAATARLGFRHFDDPQWGGRPAAEQQRIVQVARTSGVALGSLDGPAFAIDDWEWSQWQTDCIRVLKQAQAAGFRGVRVSVGPTSTDELAGCSVAIAWGKVADAVPGCDLLIEPWDDGRSESRLFGLVLFALRCAKRSNLRLSVRTTHWKATEYRFVDLLDPHGPYWVAGPLIGRVELSGHHPAADADLVSGLARLKRAGDDVTCGYVASASPTELVVETRRLQEAVLMSTADLGDHA
ncbi:MAG: hypothetical protein SH850_27335 [Planctomycetaceae bacterium]|nr:hypothetical protein [Planctomycetaceae bacterium]